MNCYRCGLPVFEHESSRMRDMTELRGPAYVMLHTRNDVCIERLRAELVQARAREESAERDAEAALLAKLESATCSAPSPPPEVCVCGWIDPPLWTDAKGNCADCGKPIKVEG